MIPSTTPDDRDLGQQPKDLPGLSTFCHACHPLSGCTPLRHQWSLPVLVFYDLSYRNYVWWLHHLVRIPKPLPSGDLQSTGQDLWITIKKNITEKIGFWCLISLHTKQNDGKLRWGQITSAGGGCVWHGWDFRIALISTSHTTESFFYYIKLVLVVFLGFVLVFFFCSPSVLFIFLNN